MGRPPPTSAPRWHCFSPSPRLPQSSAIFRPRLPPRPHWLRDGAVVARTSLIPHTRQGGGEYYERILPYPQHPSVAHFIQEQGAGSCNDGIRLDPKYPKLSSNGYLRTFPSGWVLRCALIGAPFRRLRFCTRRCGRGPHALFARREGDLRAIMCHEKGAWARGRGFQSHSLKYLLPHFVINRMEIRSILWKCLASVVKL